MKILMTFVMTLTVLVASLCQAQEAVTIGVLDKNGPLQAMKEWGATGEYLAGAIGQPVNIIPVSYFDLDQTIQDGKVDFFLVSPSMFVTAKVKHQAVSVVTMINSQEGAAFTTMGGVIFTRADNTTINKLADLTGKKFGAVSLSSYGGWQLTQKECIDNGFNIIEQVGTLRFFMKHEAVVKAVLSGKADAGTVRTDTLERMAAKGAISMRDFKIINKKEYPDFPFACSTKLYPEWLLARLASTDARMAERIGTALKLLTPDDRAAKDAKIVGWIDALDYSEVEELQRKLQLGAFK